MRNRLTDRVPMRVGSLLKSTSIRGTESPVSLPSVPRGALTIKSEMFAGGACGIGLRTGYRCLYRNSVIAVGWQAEPHIHEQDPISIVTIAAPAKASHLQGLFCCTKPLNLIKAPHSLPIAARRTPCCASVLFRFFVLSSSDPVRLPAAGE